VEELLTRLARILLSIGRGFKGDRRVDKSGHWGLTVFVGCGKTHPSYPHELWRGKRRSFKGGVLKHLKHCG